MFGFSQEEKDAAKREALRKIMRDKQRAQETEYGGGYKSQAEKDAIKAEQDAAKAGG